jgi:transcriptional regulator with XRE-family HTH domain
MPLLREVGTAVHLRRQEIGLSQQQLADLVELSRATVNALESGKLKNLSSSRIERVANELGFSVGLVGSRRARGQSEMASAARVASVSYAAEMPIQVLQDSLLRGTVPPGYIPHLRALLQEAPVALLADLAEELEQSQGTSKRQTWQRMRTLASVLNCERRLWQIAAT